MIPYLLPKTYDSENISGDIAATVCLKAGSYKVYFSAMDDSGGVCCNGGRYYNNKWRPAVWRDYLKFAVSPVEGMLILDGNKRRAAYRKTAACYGHKR